MSSAVTRRLFSTSTRRLVEQEALKAQGKKHPELPILGGVMLTAMIGAGYYWGWKGSTTGDEEASPWDPKVLRMNKPTKDVPSALNAVVVPEMRLPKEVHEKYNKWGKDGYP